MAVANGGVVGIGAELRVINVFANPVRLWVAGIVGFEHQPAGLPIGLQISARPFRDAEVLALAYAYESATDWHKRKPAL